ncbi:MAG: hypothetical protein NXI13_13545 [Proteobacteria bacterium]|nr:hypothetical protein [Pseudomonadota bacterium]
MEKVSRFFQNYSTSSLFLIVVQPVFYGCTRAAENLDKNRIYFMFYALFLAAAVSFLLTFFSGSPPVYTAEHVKLYDFDDTAFQRQTYFLYAVILFFTALFLTVTQKQMTFPYFRAVWANHRLPLETIASALILILALPLLFNYLGSITEKRAFWTVLGCLVVIFSMLGASRSAKGLFFIAVVTLGVFFALFILPLKASFIVGDGKLWMIDHHWTGVIGHGLMSTMLGPDAPTSLPEYGIYLNKLIALAAGSSFFLEMGGTIKFLQAIHLLFIVLIFVILLQRFGIRNLDLVLISFLLVLLILAPVLSGLAPTVRVPNQSPLRFVFIPIAILFAPLIARQGVFLWWIAAGILCAIAATYNLETGLISALGLGFALFIRSMKTGYLSVLTGGILFLLSFVLTAYFLLTLVVQETAELANLPSLMNLFASGYGGKTFSWYLPFFAITAHVFYLFFGWIKSSREKTPLSGTEVQSIAIVGIIIAFMPYVTNRFYEQNMWIPILLYLLLVLPKLASKEFWQKAAILLFVIVVIAPSHLERSSLFVKNLKSIWTMDLAGRCFNGLTASERLCEYLDRQSGELQEMASKEKIVWISAIPLTLSSMSNVPPSLSRADPFAYARTPEHQQELLEEITKISPDLILIDRVDILNPTGIATSVADWQKRLIADAGYRIDHQSEHWIYAIKLD